jgi:hypothetical protein
VKERMNERERGSNIWFEFSSYTILCVCFHTHNCMYCFEWGHHDWIDTFPSLSLSLSLSLPLYLCLSLSFSPSLSLLLFLSIYLSLSLTHTLSLTFFLSHSLSLYFSLSLALSLALFLWLNTFHSVDFTNYIPVIGQRQKAKQLSTFKEVFYDNFMTTRP